MNASAFSKKPIIIIVLALACLIGVINVVRSVNGGLSFNQSSSSGPAQYKIISAEEIYPAVASKTLSKRNVVQRPATNPAEQDNFCVHTYSDGTEVNQYIGQSPSNGPALNCN